MNGHGVTIVSDTQVICLQLLYFAFALMRTIQVNKRTGRLHSIHIYAVIKDDGAVELSGLCGRPT